MSKIKTRLPEFYYSLSIRKKVGISFIVGFLLLLTILATFTYKISSRILINKAIVNTVQNINLVLRQFDIIFDNAENYSKIAITNKDVQEILSDVEPEGQLEKYINKKIVQGVLGDIIYPKTFIDSVIIYDFKGNIYDSGGIIIDREDNELISKFVHSADLLKWTDTQRSKYEREQRYFNVVTLLRKMKYKESGKSLGVIETCIQEKYISSLYSNIKIGDSGKIFIANLNGRIVSHNDKSMIYSSISKEPYFNWMKSSEGGKIFVINGVKKLVVCRHYSRLNWIISGVVPLDEVTRDNEELVAKMVLVGVICVILGSCFIYTAICIHNQTFD